MKVKLWIPACAGMTLVFPTCGRIYVLDPRVRGYDEIITAEITRINSGSPRARV